MTHTEYIVCRYHSERWRELVEQGWRTHTVVLNVALMIRETRVGYA